MNEAAKAVLDNLMEFATVYTKAYLAFVAAGLPVDVAQNEARLIAFLAVSPANVPPNMTGFGPKEGQA